MGSGDWNDGLNRVGGESVWLGWFLSCCALRFSELLERLDDGRAGHYRALSEQTGRAADAAFNGRWYLRAWREDSRALGDGERIDSLSQSWAAFCPWATPEKVELALENALARLRDTEHGLVKLLSPPYPAADSPGYLSGYGEGFRENGGQYTHAAIWLALACLRRGREREGKELLRMLLPENAPAERYEAEPFVLPADVCSAPGRIGCAGWTWYTGSAGWYFRAVCEGLLGLRLKDGKLQARPGVLNDYAVEWRDPMGEVHHIEVRGGMIL
jgi:cyclic beta-1,2-glucan synthetase